MTINTILGVNLFRIWTEGKECHNVSYLKGDVSWKCLCGVKNIFNSDIN